MSHPQTWLETRPEGLYCIPGQFYIDPSRPVEAAVITHGHADHARSGHNKLLATRETIEIIKARYGNESASHFQALGYHEKIYHNQVQIYFLPAGHILGSAQIVIEFDGKRVIVSGDYKRAYDPTCDSFQIETCDVFITEATFSLPVFKHPPIENELNKLLNSLQEQSDCAHLVGAYALGKCQRIIKTLRLLNYHETIYLHGTQIKLCDLYQRLGVDLGKLEHASVLNKNNSAGKIIMCPPSALHDRWTRRFGNTVIANASGWMQIRARAKQKGVDLPLIISDHADWDELTQTIFDVNPKEVWVTHGREEALVYFTEQNGYKAQALSLLGYEDDSNED